MAPSLAVLIVSWNVRDLLARCVEALRSDLDRSGIGAPIVVVDNASQDGSGEMIRARYPGIHLIALDRNSGFAGGNNVGLRWLGLAEPPAASPQAGSGEMVEQGRGPADFVLLLNPDAEVQPGATPRLLDAMDARRDAAVMTARLSYGDGSFQHSAFRFPDLAQLVIDLFPAPARVRESRLNGRYPRRAYAAGRIFEIDHPLGAVMLVRAAAARQVGLLDAGFDLYCEEIDWCARFKEAGWRNYCVPAAHVVHHGGQSTSQVKVESFRKLWTARYRLHTRHPRFAPLPLARRIVHAGMRRQMRRASPEWSAACRDIIQVWR